VVVQQVHGVRLCRTSVWVKLASASRKEFKRITHGLARSQ
jgi:hypothetical protein